MGGSYNYWLVLLSLVLAVAASFAALSIAARIPFVERRMLWLWMGGGSISMGLAIWSMHFVGMLAFHIDIPLAYDIPLTSLSIFYAVFASAIAIFVVRLGFNNKWSLLISTLFMGSGIAAMHYTGMDALKMTPEILYDRRLFVLSLLIAYVASFVALRLFLTQGMNFEIAHRLFDQHRFNAAIIMGVAIAGMHYTAMEAAIIDPRSVCNAVDNGIDSGIVSILIVLGVILVISITVLLLVLEDKYSDNRKLQFSEQRVKQVIDSAPQGMLVIDENGIIQEVNRSIETLFGYTRDELLGELVEKLLPIPQREKYSQLRNGFMQNPEFRPMGGGLQMQASRKDGKEFRVEVGLSSMQLDNQVNVLATIIDITQRLQLENELRQKQSDLEYANKRIMLAADVTGIGIWEYVIDENLIIWDSMMYELYGVTGDSNPCTYESWEKMVHPEDVKEATELLKQVVQAENEYDAEFRIVRPDGVIRWMKLHATHVKNTDGRVIRIIGTNQDISERKEYANTLESIVKNRTNELEQARQKAEDANEYKGLFLANMSHELRTPMHAISSFTKLALKREKDEKNLKYLNNIDASATRLTTLLNDLLDLSKLEAGKMVAEYEACNILDLVNENIQMLESLINEKQLEIAVLQCGPSVMEADRKMMGQVIMNLLSNAIKFSPVKGKIKIEFKPSARTSDIAINNQLYFTVSDQGPGIPGEEIDLVFDQFVQSSKTRTYSGNTGTGLGLPISREIIDLHHGRIWASSPVEDKALVTADQSMKGSTFHIVLPLTQI